MSASATNILDDVEVTSQQDGRVTLSASVRLTIKVSDEEAPDQIQKEVEEIGQQVKREAYAHLLQQVESRIVTQFQVANANLQRRGSRRFSFVAPFGKVQIRRSRVWDRVTGKWSVPAQLVWKTPHRHCLLPGLKESCCQQVQGLSVRKTAKAMSEMAGVWKIISPATVVNLYHEEGRRLEQTQCQQARETLEQYPQALSSGLAGPFNDVASRQGQEAPSQKKLWFPTSYYWSQEKEEEKTSATKDAQTANDELSPAAQAESVAQAPSSAACEPSSLGKAKEDAADPPLCFCKGGHLPSYYLERDEEELPELTERQEQEIRQRAIGFFSCDQEPPSHVKEERLVKEEDTGSKESSTPSDSPSGAGDAPVRRSPDDDWVVVQVDDVQTKAQPGERQKRTYTFTATIESEGQILYYASCCAWSLWKLVAAALCRLGVLEGIRGVLVIGDGASWIQDWYSIIKLPKRELVLCWYHLTKRVHQRFSQCRLPKARREEMELLILGHLWKGELADAVWHLWDIREEAGKPEMVMLLIQYLMARREYLPNYQARHRAGLWIASTRVEKWNDLAVSDRCKRRGMSWTAAGVLALALHQSHQRNGSAQTESQNSRCAA